MIVFCFPWLFIKNMPSFALPLPSSCTSFILVVPYPHFSQFLLFKVYLETIGFFSIVTLTSSSCYGSVFQRIHSPPCANQELVQISQFLESLKTLFLDSDFTLRWNRRTLIGCLKSCCHFQPKSSSSRAA